MRLRVGTSGFSYKEWKGSFYPEDLPAAKMLPYYAERFDTVEINNTFYRMPQASLLAGWKAEVPSTFTFVLKAPQRITHMKRLAEVDAIAQTFFDTAATLGKQLGPILVQLPPYLKKDVERLKAFFDVVPDGVRIALETGHASWLDEETYALLRERGVSLVIVDDPKKRIPLVVTAKFAYFRLREVSYQKRDLARWVSQIREQKIAEAWVFFKHEDEGTGPRLAKMFRELWDASS